MSCDDRTDVAANEAAKCLGVSVQCLHNAIVCFIDSAEPSSRVLVELSKLLHVPLHGFDCAGKIVDVILHIEYRMLLLCISGILVG